MRYTRSIPALLGVLAVFACVDADRPLDPGRASAARQTPQQGPRYALPPQARSRWDTPWWKMSDSELADSVAAAHGRVFIGFKEPGARGGVDDWGQVIVSDATVAAGKRSLRSLGLAFDMEHRLIPAVVTTIAPSQVARLRALPFVDYVEPVVIGTYDVQDTTWNVRRVRAPEAWQSSTGAGVKLLIIDSGVDSAHPDLNPAVVQACDGTNGLDQLGHGTHVSGIAAAVNNTQHVIGVAHGAALWSSKVGTSAPSSAAVECAVEFGRINQTFVMSMSLSITPLTSLTDEIKGAYADGLLLVAAAGNTNGGAVTYPATLAEVIAVAATDINNNRASFGALGPEVELAAPGVSITSTSLPSGSVCTTGGLTASCSGTSMAAPHVAAAAAILKAFNATWSNVVIRDRLQKTAIDLGAAGRDNNFGFGLIDIRAALDFVPPPPPPPPPLNVNIQGPTTVQPFSQCLYQALVQGGTSPYNYAWQADGVPVGDNSPFYRHPAGTNSFTLQVTVTDAAGSTGGNILEVTVSSGAPECLDT